MSAQFLDMWTTFSPLFIMWAAVIINLILPLPFSAHPARIWHQFAHLLAAKVNTHQHYRQDFFSGSLACGLMLLPAMTLLFAIQNLAWQPQYFQFALLLLALDWRHQHQVANKMGHWLGEEAKENARSELKPLLNRQVDSLSLVGLGKATSEVLISGHSRHVIGVLFWFAISGGIGAFMYRLTCELHRAWSPSQPGYRPFGLVSARLVLVLEWVPVRIFIGLLLIGKNRQAIWQGAQKQAASWPSPSQGWLLSVIGHKLQLSLGGPAIYDNIKSVRAKLGGKIAPSALHISQLMALLNQTTWYWLILQSGIIALFCLVPHV
jgi:adenosylcobinamide-phosphate synthase